MIVGLSLMKRSSCRTSVSEPNTSTMTAVTSGMAGKRRVSTYDTASASSTATMKTAVATKIPPRSPDAMSAGSIGETSGKNSAGRELARKKSNSGPKSSTSLRRGWSCNLALMAAHVARPRRNCHGCYSLARDKQLLIDPRNRSREVLGREGRQIVDAFPHADEMDGQAEFCSDGDQDAAARGAVELGHDKPSDPGDIAKNLDLGERVLSDRRVQHQQNGMRRRRIDLLHDAHDLLKFFHQHRLVLQPPGSVHEQHVDLLAARFGERIEGDPRGVGARRARDNRSAAAPAPNIELVDGGRAEGIARGKHHRAALGAEPGGKLADGGGLA